MIIFRKSNFHESNILGKSKRRMREIWEADFRYFNLFWKSSVTLLQLFVLSWWWLLVINQILKLATSVLLSDQDKYHLVRVAHLLLLLRMYYLVIIVFVCFSCLVIGLQSFYYRYNLGSLSYSLKWCYKSYIQGQITQIRTSIWAFKYKI